MKPTATVIHFYMGDVPDADAPLSVDLVSMMQDAAVPLSHAMYGDVNILLKHDVDAGPFELSRRAEDKADAVLAPTGANLVAALQQLDREGYQIDLFIFAHGFRDGGFTVSRGVHGQTAALFGPALIDAFGRDLDSDPLALRMVHSIGCWGEALRPTWEKLGAVATVGTTGVNFMPHRFRRFIWFWKDDKTLRRTVQLSNGRLVRDVTYTYYAAHAMMNRNRWNADGPGTVLGRSDKARRCFQQLWDAHGWVEGKTGRQNIVLSSAQVVSGRRDLRIGDPR